MSDVPGPPPPPPPPGGGQQPPPPPPAPGGPQLYQPPPPSYGTPPPVGGAAPPAQPGSYAPQAPTAWTGLPLADYGQRVIAYLIDIGIAIVAAIVIVIVAAILGAVSSALGTLVGLLGYLAVLVYAFWNIAYLQGTTGQSIGKRQQGISLVKEETQQPVGFGMAFIRYLLAGALSSVTCGIYGLLDILFPLWDAKRQRITDKILKMGVVKTAPGTLDFNSLNPFNKPS